MTILAALFWAFGLTIFVLGLQGLLYFPLTLVYEAWKRRTLARLPPFAGKVTVVVTKFEDKLLNGPNDLWILPGKGLYLFWSGTRQEFFDLYEKTARVLKAFDRIVA